MGPLTKCFRNTRLKRNEHITAGSWKWRKAHLHPSFSPLAEAWGKRLKLSIRESQHSYQTKGEHPIVIRFLTYAENSASQSSAQPLPPSEDTEEEQSNGATTRTATSTSYQDGLVICVDITSVRIVSFHFRSSCRLATLPFPSKSPCYSNHRKYQF